MSYKITMGGSREDYTIRYSEREPARRELIAAVDVEFNEGRRPKARLYLLSFRKWNSSKIDLTPDEHSIVLKRISDFIRSEGFEVEFDSKEPIW